MAKQVIFPEDLRVNGNFSAGSITYPSGSVDKAAIKQAAGIEATKLEHQHSIRFAQANGADVVSVTELLHIFRAAGEIVSVEIVPATIPSGDYEYTVDVQKGNASTAYASVLTSPLTVDSASVTRTVQEGTVDTTTTADGDSLQVVVTPSGTTGTQGQGFILIVTVREGA